MKTKVLKFVCVLFVFVLSFHECYAQWGVGGNTLTGTPSAPDQFIGSLNAYNFVVKTNGVARMHVSGVTPTAGFVSINSTSFPRQFNIYTTQVNGGLRVTQTNPNGGFSALELFNSTSQGHNWALVSTGNGNAESGGNFGVFDYTGTSSNQAGYRLFISKEGMVGIGTKFTTPLARLHVVGDFSLFTQTASAPTSAAAIRGNDGYSDQTDPDFTWWNNDQTGIFHSAPNVIGFTNGGLESMRIELGGKVVIGGSGVTNLPSGNNYKLYVTGGILTEQLRIGQYGQAGWADYVFSPNYTLMNLSDIERFVEKNKHLPNIPSAKEVSEKGIDVWEMNNKLLEKVEELTLYIIDLNKRLETLEK